MDLGLKHKQWHKGNFSRTVLQGSCDGRQQSPLVFWLLGPQQSPRSGRADSALWEFEITGPRGIKSTCNRNRNSQQGVPGHRAAPRWKGRGFKACGSGAWGPGLGGLGAGECFEGFGRATLEWFYSKIEDIWGLSDLGMIAGLGDPQDWVVEVWKWFLGLRLI